MVLVVAGLWILVFIPSWFHRSEDRDVYRTEVQSQRQVIREVRKAPIASLLSVAERSHKLGVRVRSGLTVAMLGLLVGLGSIAFAVQYVSGWILVAAGLATFAISTGVVRRANKERSKLAEHAARSRGAKSGSLSGWAKELQTTPAIAEVEIDPRAWTPNRLPNPVHMSRVGELEVAVMADVLAISHPEKVEEVAIKANPLEAEMLDEILRRRRAVG